MDDLGSNGFDFLEFGNFSYIISLLTIPTLQNAMEG
jgi:hypothetical protein